MCVFYVNAPLPHLNNGAVYFDLRDNINWQNNFEIFGDYEEYNEGIICPQLK